MKNESVEKRVLQLWEVEKLSIRQITKVMKISRKRIQRIIRHEHPQRPGRKAKVLESYQHLIEHWYEQYPNLQALQVYQRLRSYGYKGSYATVILATQRYRHKKTEAYHALSFLPGEEAQVDWFFFQHPTLGKVAGFLYVLAYSRYAWGEFYPRTSFEFFLAGHLECFRHLGGLAHRHRYDNLKSVILKRTPQEEYNPQFLDFSRFYGFSILVCNPYKGNEKGRVERLIRDIRSFLETNTFSDLKDLNQKFHAWLKYRNQRIHRTTGKTPQELLAYEQLLGLPQASYPPTRILTALVSKTAFVEFETNRYSVPTGLATQQAQIVVYPDRLEISVNGQKVASHPRCFRRMQTIENAWHRQRLLSQTSAFKYQRIFHLIEDMDRAFRHFLSQQDSPQDKIQAAYELFLLLKTHSKTILISAVQELIQMGTFKIKALRSLLRLPDPKEGDPVWPRDSGLLNLYYQPRSLEDYDPIS
jgi:transposase